MTRCPLSGSSVEPVHSLRPSSSLPRRLPAPVQMPSFRHLSLHHLGENLTAKPSCPVHDAVPVPSRCRTPTLRRSTGGVARVQPLTVLLLFGMALFAENRLRRAGLAPFVERERCSGDAPWPPAVMPFCNKDRYRSLPLPYAKCGAPGGTLSPIVSSSLPRPRRRVLHRSQNRPGVESPSRTRQGARPAGLADPRRRTRNRRLQQSLERILVAREADASPVWSSGISARKGRMCGVGASGENQARRANITPRLGRGKATSTFPSL